MLGLHLTPIWLLHAVLLPLNVWRLTQALASDLPGQADAELRHPIGLRNAAANSRERPEFARTYYVRQEAMMTFDDRTENTIRSPLERAVGSSFVDPHDLATSRPWTLSAIGRRVAKWRERERDRRELAMMSHRDFGDLVVPPGLVREETRQWPWRGWNQGWDAIAVPRKRQSPRLGKLK